MKPEKKYKHQFNYFRRYLRVTRKDKIKNVDI